MKPFLALIFVATAAKYFIQPATNYITLANPEKWSFLLQTRTHVQILVTQSAITSAFLAPRAEAEKSAPLVYKSFGREILLPEKSQKSIPGVPRVFVDSLTYVSCMLF